MIWFVMGVVLVATALIACLMTDDQHYDEEDMIEKMMFMILDDDAEWL